MNKTTYRLIGGALALGAYTLAGTVLAATPVAGPVIMLGGLLAGWLSFETPPEKARKKKSNAS